MSTPRGEKGTINIDIKNLNELARSLTNVEEVAEKAVKKTLSDFKSRAPAWISAAVTDPYGIKKSEVKDAISGKKKIGSIAIAGITVDSVAIEYSGRPLTPTHFKMKPTKVPAKREKAFKRVPGSGVGEGGGNVAMVKAPAPYTVTAEVYKGKRKVLGSDVFLGTNKGTGVIPFQRTGKGRTPIESIKSTSVPQMITNEKVTEEIKKNIDEGLGKRLQHHVAQELNKLK